MKKFITLLLVFHLVQAESLDEKVKKLEQQIKALKTLLSQPHILTDKQNKVNIGGYGELHYNINHNRNGNEGRNQIDFHRYVLFFNYKFNKDIKFFSELELEHSLAADDAPGEVELEQAFIQMELAQGLYFKAGVFLIPIGILNETHEPPTFYGVERNPVEGDIIPVTWWEAGIALTKQFDNGITIDWALHSGLSVDSDFDIRNARQKVANANADEWATTLRLKYYRSGLELATTMQYQNDLSTRDSDSTLNNTADNNAFLYSIHGIYQTGNFTFKTLYAAWNIANVEDVEDASPSKKESQNQYGFLIEPSYKLTDKFGVFARFFTVDAAKASDDVDGVTFGVNYWPTPQVVFKADITIEEEDKGNQNDSVNLGIGYQF